MKQPYLKQIKTLSFKTRNFLLENTHCLPSRERKNGSGYSIQNGTNGVHSNTMFQKMYCVFNLFHSHHLYIMNSWHSRFRMIACPCIGRTYPLVFDDFFACSS